MAWRVVDAEGVLLHSDTSAYFGLNGSATVLWRQLAERAMTPADLTVWARVCYPDAGADLGGDVTVFIDELQSLDLIEGTEDPVEASLSARPGLGADASATDGGTYEPPQVLRFGELEKLILSGE